MTIYDFMDKHWFVTVILSLIGASTIAFPFRCVAIMYSRMLRSRNIAARGWPPAHLDADGDPVKNESAQ